jgi:hypothetical protein
MENYGSVANGLLRILTATTIISHAFIPRSDALRLKWQGLDMARREGCNTTKPIESSEQIETNRYDGCYISIAGN